MLFMFCFCKYWGNCSFERNGVVGLLVEKGGRGKGEGRKGGREEGRKEKRKKRRKKKKIENRKNL